VGIRVLTRKIILGLAALVLLLPVRNFAAEPEPADALALGIVPRVEDGKRIYTVAQFARFAPQTAADIVQQIPGFSITEISTDRGLGEASQNVLINGQRITGKGNDALTVLRRIPVRSVRGLEILDGAMLDISGLAGQVLNLLMEQDSVQGNYAWRPQFRERVGNHLQAGEVSVSGKSGIGTYALGLRWDGFRGGGWGNEVQTYPNAGISYVRAQQPRFANDLPKLSGSLNRKSDAGSIWNINASIDWQHFRRHVLTNYQVPGETPTLEDSRGENRKLRGEIGTDYEFALGEGRLKLVGFFSERDGPNSNDLISEQEGEVPTGARFTRDSTDGERVLRTEYRWKDLGADWSLSAEAAHNFVDATGSLSVLDSAGEYQPVTLQGATLRVEEQRAESILAFSRVLGPRWSMQLSGGGEYSQLKQDGENGQTRSFWRPKGAVAFAWNPGTKWEMNLKLQRKVGQLDFFDFLASVDLTNNNTNGNNPELVPPQSWGAQVETIRSLGRHGKLRFTIEAEDISDYVDQVPISATLEAQGNVPKAREVQYTLDASLLLDAWGIPGGKLDTFINIKDTRIRDPLLGTHRHLNGNRYYWNVDFRHDVPGTPWTWGLFAEQSGKNYFYRLDSLQVNWGSRPFGAIFLEHKNVFGAKVRASVVNLYNSKDRTRYEDYVDRRDGPIDYTRDYKLTFHPFYRLQVTGTF
jgi:outer membrane receptor for ferrienterochelin and colicins